MHCCRRIYNYNIQNPKKQPKQQNQPKSQSSKRHSAASAKQQQRNKELGSKEDDAPVCLAGVVSFKDKTKPAHGKLQRRLKSPA